MTPIVLLFVAGVTLIFSEFFVPGITLGVVGSVLVVVSIALGWHRYPEYGIFILAGETTGVIVIIGLGLLLLVKTPLGRGLVLKANQQTSAGYSSYAEDQTLVGKLATVHTALRPAGSIMLERRRIDAVSNGMFIDAGKTVRIIQVEGHRVVCEEAKTDDTRRSG
jgi:membrane-bound serine protease (ClpP class)